MASIGELFKTLGKDQTFNEYCNELDNGKTNSEIIELAFEDEELMINLRKIIDDNNIIKNKMEIIVGQKRKAYESKKQNESNKQCIETLVNKELINTTTDDELEEAEETGYELSLKPFNDSKTIMLNKYTFMEPIDHRFRLVNYDIEMFY
jgi:hypothetical protein